jgi:hypothetical protein
MGGREIYDGSFNDESSQSLQEQRLSQYWYMSSKLRRWYNTERNRTFKNETSKIVGRIHVVDKNKS